MAPPKRGPGPAAPVAGAAQRPVPSPLRYAAGCRACQQMVAAGDSLGRQPRQRHMQRVGRRVATIKIDEESEVAVPV